MFDGSVFGSVALRKGERNLSVVSGMRPFPDAAFRLRAGSEPADAAECFPGCRREDDELDAAGSHQFASEQGGLGLRAISSAVVLGDVTRVPGSCETSGGAKGESSKVQVLPAGDRRPPFRRTRDARI